jgi:hypothetical protein
MAKESAMSRRRLLGVAGVASLVVLATSSPPAQAEGKVKYPAIRKAITEMKEAVKELEEGRKIFGGHRLKAIKAMKMAIDECEAAIKFAEKGS